MDESGFCLVCPLKRTWAPKGQTPKIRTHIQHNKRINVIGAVVVSPKGRRIKLCIQSHECTVAGEQIIVFLEHLLSRIDGPIVLVWDNHPIHHRQKVQAFLDKHPRVHAFNSPSYAPELNPAEFVWTQTSDYMAGRTPITMTELRANLQAGLHRIRVSQSRLWACVYASDLPSFPWKK
jgi:transposase